MMLKKRVINILDVMVVAGGLLTCCVSLTACSHTAPRDYLLGYYELQGPSYSGRIIPVFKAEGTYYTVSWPAAEIPLKPCPEGLEWALTPSSMIGTTIIYDKQSSRPYFISVHDSVAAHNTACEEADWWGTGKKRQLIKIDKPSWLPDPTARRPRTIDDFLGWYRLAWAPGKVFEIRRNGNKYLAAFQYMEKPGQWKPQGEPREITLLPDRLGFTGFDRGNGINLIYNTARKRYELTKKAEDGSTIIYRIPLARVTPEKLSQSEAASIPTIEIGIPSWH